MRVAILGSGFMGRTHANALRQIQGVKLAGVFTRNKRKAQKGFEDCTIYDSFEELIKEEKPDVISVCLPTYLHKEYVIKGAKLGIHVICEKPISLNLDDAKEMIETCKENNVRLFIGHVLRFFPEYQKVKEAVEENQLGELGVLHAKRVNENPTIKSEWYGNDTKSGGVILDLVIHDIDFMRYLNGEVKTVFAQRQKQEYIDLAYITLKFENDVIGNIVGHWGKDIDLEYSLEVYGKDGIVQLNSKNKPISVKKHNEVYYQVRPSAEQAYINQLKHFIECLGEEKEPLVTVDDACKAVEIALAALESIETGQTINLKSV